MGKGGAVAKRAQERSLAKEEHVSRSLGLREEVGPRNSCHFFCFACKPVNCRGQPGSKRWLRP